MAFVTIAGEPGCRTEEVARLTAQLLRFELVTESMLRERIARHFGSENAIPEKAWSAAVTSILARIGLEAPVVVCVPDAEMLFPDLPPVLRVQLVASEARRTGALMIEHRLDRAAARHLLGQIERHQRLTRKKRFGRAYLAASAYDVTVSLDNLDGAHVATLLEAAARARGVADAGKLAEATEAQLQFQARMQLAQHGITPAGYVALKKKIFANPSEEIFANLLDFYRIHWEYEPKSFPIQFDAEGKVTEAFTPDFYLPEFDLYVELTTMKQAHVTRKNHKVRMLRSLYPHINVQVFYQKDFQNLIFKHGLSGRTVEV